MRINKDILVDIIGKVLAILADRCDILALAEWKF